MTICLKGILSVNVLKATAEVFKNLLVVLTFAQSFYFLDRLIDCNFKNEIALWHLVSTNFLLGMGSSSIIYSINGFHFYILVSLFWLVSPIFGKLDFRLGGRAWICGKDTLVTKTMTRTWIKQKMGKGLVTPAKMTIDLLLMLWSEGPSIYAI